MKSPLSSGKQRRPRFFAIRRVTGESMLPTLRDGVVVVVRCSTHPLRVGDVGLFRYANREIIKRVQSVVGGGYYVVGDNLGRSTDSRSFGALHKEHAVGRVIWPRCSQ